MPRGEVRFVFLAEDGVSFREEVLGENRYVRLTVPPSIWFGFKGLSKSRSLILNLANIEHDPLEVERLHINDMKFNWKNK